MTEHTYTEADLHALDDAAFNRVIAQMAGVHQWEARCTLTGALLEPLRETASDYASSLDAAWGLAQWVSLHMVLEGAHWVVIVHDGAQGGAYSIETPNPARALSTAWLLWKQERTQSEERED